MPARPFPALLACALLACARADPTPTPVPDPVPTSADAPSAPGGMAPPPAPVSVEAEPNEATVPPYEPRVDPDTVVVPPLDRATEDALKAFVTAQRSIAAEGGREVHGPNDAYDLVLSPGARVALPSVKRAAREAARRVLGAALAEGAEGPRPLTGKVLSTLLLKAFATAGAAVYGPLNRASPQSIGTVEAIEVERPAGHPDKLTIVVVLSLPCGSDGSFYVLEEQRGGAPRVVMAVEANGYSSITGGHLALTAGITPPDARGGWFAVVAHARPWCSSAWRGIDYRVFRPGASPEAPLRVLEKTDSAYLGERFCAITTTTDGFTVSYASRNPFSDDLLRSYVHRYERRDGAFVRAQPIVARAIDLPDEWATMPWAEARRFTAAPNAEALRPWHALLARAADERDGAVAVEREDAAGGRARLSLTCTRCKIFSGRLLVDVKRDGPGWAMEAVTPAP